MSRNNNDEKELLQAIQEIRSLQNRIRQLRQKCQRIVDQPNCDQDADCTWIGEMDSIPQCQISRAHENALQSQLRYGQEKGWWGPRAL